MIEDLRGRGPEFEPLRLPNGERYFSFEAFRTSGLLIASQLSVLSIRGFAVAFVYADQACTQLVGWDIVGTGRSPMVPKMDDYQAESMQNFHILTTPAIDPRKRRRV